jgi:hypothetical protein
MVGGWGRGATQTEEKHPVSVEEKETCMGMAPPQPDSIHCGPQLFVPAVVSLCRLAENNSNDFHFIATSILGSQNAA